MSEQYTVEHFCFTDKGTYERAVKEQKVIEAMRDRYDLSSGKTAYRLYQKAVEEKAFTTVVGYTFLKELRSTALKTKAVKEKELSDIPVKAGADVRASESVPPQKRRPDKYRNLYEGQRLLNRRLKIVVMALLVLVIAFVVIDLRSEYSVFTYFTDYKSKMEEELIDKYENWESELKAREDALNQSK